MSHFNKRQNNYIQGQDRSKFLCSFIVWI